MISVEALPIVGTVLPDAVNSEVHLFHNCLLIGNYFVIISVIYYNMLQKLPVIPDILRFFLEMAYTCQNTSQTATCKQQRQAVTPHQTGRTDWTGEYLRTAQIVHKINDCLTDLGAVTEIILGQEFSLLCSLHHRLR